MKSDDEVRVTYFESEQRRISKIDTLITEADVVGGIEFSESGDILYSESDGDKLNEVLSKLQEALRENEFEREGKRYYRAHSRELYITTLLRIARIHQKKREFGIALEILERALKIHREFVDPSSSRELEILSSLKQVCLLTTDEGAAETNYVRFLRVCQEFVMILQRIEKKNERELVAAFLDLGLAYIKCPGIADPIHSFEKAGELYIETAGDELLNRDDCFTADYEILRRFTLISLTSEEKKEVIGCLSELVFKHYDLGDIKKALLYQIILCDFIKEAEYADRKVEFSNLHILYTVYSTMIMDGDETRRLLKKACSAFKAVPFEQRAEKDLKLSLCYLYCLKELKSPDYKTELKSIKSFDDELLEFDNYEMRILDFELKKEIEILRRREASFSSYFSSKLYIEYLNVLEADSQEYIPITFTGRLNMEEKLVGKLESLARTGGGMKEKTPIQQPHHLIGEYGQFFGNARNTTRYEVSSYSNPLDQFIAKRINHLNESANAKHRTSTDISISQISRTSR